MARFNCCDCHHRLRLRLTAWKESGMPPTNVTFIGSDVVDLAEDNTCHELAHQNNEIIARRQPPDPQIPLAFA